MSGHVRLLVFDLDFTVFDCAALKVGALRQTLISFGAAMPGNVNLPQVSDIEEGYLEHGYRWLESLDLGLDPEAMAHVEDAYRVHEARLVGAGVGEIFPPAGKILRDLKESGRMPVLGADAGREYLLAVSDRYRLDGLLGMSYSIEDYGAGSYAEMLLEIMRQAEVNPSETVLVGTRPAVFEAARGIDIPGIACRWGLRNTEAAGAADFQARTPEEFGSALSQADKAAARFLE